MLNLINFVFFSIFESNYFTDLCLVTVQIQKGNNKYFLNLPLGFDSQTFWQCKPLNMITLGQPQSDNINQMITITKDNNKEKQVNKRSARISKIIENFKNLQYSFQTIDLDNWHLVFLVLIQWSVWYQNQCPLFK